MTEIFNRSRGIKIEEAVRDIEGIEKVDSVVQEGFSNTILTLFNEVKDIDAVLRDVKNEVDALAISEEQTVRVGSPAWCSNSDECQRRGNRVHQGTRKRARSSI